MKSVIVHGLLAVLGLGLAWMVWSGGEAERRSDGEVAIINCPSIRLTSVELLTEDRLVQLEIQRGEGPKAWFSHTTPPPGAADKVAGKSDKKATPPTVKRFAAGIKVDKLLPRLAPLQAVRALGEVPADRMKALELDDPKRTLTITCGGDTRKLAIGATTYGASSRYARDLAGGPVYLIKASLISDLEMSRARFMQRDLHDFPLPDVETAKVSAQGKERTLLHRDRRNPTGANWVDAADPDRRNELYGNWLTRVLRLRALEYVAEGQLPGADRKPKVTPMPVVKIAWRGDRTGQFELVKLAGKAPDYFARSHATGGWVKVPATLARQVADDVPAILGLEVPAVPEPKEATVTEAPEPAPAAAKSSGRPVFAVPDVASLKTPRMPSIPALAAPPRPKPVSAK